MNWKQIIILIFRLILGAVFVFSGFVKAVDPWGTAFKLQEYFHTFGLGGLGEAAFALSILLSGVELTLGLALLSGVRLRFTTLCTLLFMTGFTALTLWSALTNPVADCGCFGDAVKLTNWQTFYKNLALWPMSLVVWLSAHHRAQHRKREGSLYGSINPAEIYVRTIGGYHASDRGRRKYPCKGGWFVLFVYFVMSCGVGLYAMLHLPPIDFLPYKKGVNIREAMRRTDTGTTETTLVYRDKTDRSLHEFALSDTTWYDTVRWEYVDTRVVRESRGAKTDLVGFAIFNGGEDITDRVLNDPGRVYLLVVTDLDDIPDYCKTAFREVVPRARQSGSSVYCITPASLKGPTVLRLGDGEPVPVYNIDATTLKTMLRARTGLIVLENGTILDKKNCRDLPGSRNP